MHETHWHGYEPGPQGQPVVPNPAAGTSVEADMADSATPGPEPAQTAAETSPRPGLLGRLRTARREARIALAVGLSVGILAVALAINQLRPRGKATKTAEAVASKSQAGKPSPSPKGQPAPKPAPASPTLALNALGSATPPLPTPIEPEPEEAGPAGIENAPEPSVAVDDENPLLTDNTTVDPPLPLALDGPPAATGPDEGLVEPPLPAAAPVSPEPLAAAGQRSLTPPLPEPAPAPQLPPATTADLDPPVIGRPNAPAATVPPPDQTSKRLDTNQGPEPRVATNPAAIPALTPAPPTAPLPSSPSGTSPIGGNTVPLPHAGSMSELKVERLLGESRRVVPAPAERPGAVAVATPPADRVEPIRHVVQKGENFATIAKLYYGSMRFYKALWKANQDVVPAPEKLYVGATVRVPPPEMLDPALIERPKAPAAPVAASKPPTRKDDQTRRTGQNGLVMLPHGQSGRSSSEGEPIEAPAPSRTHVVKTRETLRSIARDQLGDARRESEILDLNRGVLGETAELRPGMRLRLPGDGSETRIR